MGPWLVLIDSLQRRPQEAKPQRGAPHIKERQAALKAASQAEVLEAIADFEGGVTADVLAEIVGFSYQHTCSICTALEKDGKLTSYKLNDSRARRKVWKVI